MAAPLGNIDKLVVIDQGNGSGDGGSSGLGRLAKTSPAVVFNLLQQLEALGLNVPSMMAQLGLQQGNGTMTPPPAEPAKPSKPSLTADKRPT